MSHILLYYAFLLFWSIFKGNSLWTSLFIQKKTILETCTEKLRKFVFLTVCEGGKILRIIWICLNKYFWLHQLKGIIINKTCFSPSYPHTVKLCLSVVFKHFWGNSQRTSLFSQKSDYFRNAHWNNLKVCFSYHVWKGPNPEENLDLFKPLFLIKPVKGDKY